MSAAPHLRPVTNIPPTSDDNLDDGREPIEVTNVAIASDWLAEHIGTGHLSGYFRRGDEMVFTTAIGAFGYIPPVQDAQVPASLATPAFQEIAAVTGRLYNPFKMVKDGEGHTRSTPAPFPYRAAQDATCAAHLLPNLRAVRGVIRTPIARADGSILDTPGYDPASCLLLLPDLGLDVKPVPDFPTPHDVAVAVEVIDTMLAEFPFKTVHDRANYIGLMMTPLIREICPAPYKLGIIQAHQPGSGKSYLATAMRIVHGGKEYSDFPKDDEEMRKKITTILKDTPDPVITFDNVQALVSGAVLAGLLTAKVWSDRPLKTSSVFTAPNDKLWTITGNNVRIGGDLKRRVLWCTIDPQCPDPDKRTGFKIPNFLRWVKEHRGDLIHALLVLVRAWHLDGRPTDGVKSSDDFADWVEVVDGVLTHAGIPGTFAATDTEPVTEGADDAELGDFLDAVYAQFGTEPWTCKALLERVNDRPDAPNEMWNNKHPISIDAIPDRLADRLGPGQQPTTLAKALGKWLVTADGRWVRNRTVKNMGKTRDDIVQWSVQTADSVKSRSVMR